MRTTEPEATAAKQNWPDEASAAARNELMVAMTILGVCKERPGRQSEEREREGAKGMKTDSKREE